VFSAGYVLAESAAKEEVIAKCKETSQLIQGRAIQIDKRRTGF
jgi:hypothetical protein